MGPAFLHVCLLSLSCFFPHPFSVCVMMPRVMVLACFKAQLKAKISWVVACLVMMLVVGQIFVGFGGCANDNVDVHILPVTGDIVCIFSVAFSRSFYSYH